MEKPNRAERRRNKFGGGRATEHGGWPTVRPNPVFEVENADADAAGADPPGAGTRPRQARPKTAPGVEGDKDSSAG